MTATSDTSTLSDLDLGPSEEIRCPSCGTGARIHLDAVKIVTSFPGDPDGMQIGTVHADGNAGVARFPGFPVDYPSVALECTCHSCGTGVVVVAAQWRTQVRITVRTNPPARQQAENDTNGRTAP